MGFLDLLRQYGPQQFREQFLFQRGKHDPSFVDRLKGTVQAQAPSPTPTFTPTPTPNLKDWENFKPYIAREARTRGYSPAALVSQMAIESDRGRSNFARDRFNYGGIGAVDSNPNQAYSFKSPEDYMGYYFKMIQKRFPEAYKVRGNGPSYVEQLKRANYATDPDYVWKVLNTPEYKTYDY